MPRCPKCSQENVAGKFCGKCGFPLKPTFSKQSVKAPTPPSENKPDEQSDSDLPEENPFDKASDLIKKLASSGSQTGYSASSPELPPISRPPSVVPAAPKEVEKPEIADIEKDDIEKLQADVKASPSSFEAYFRLALAQFKKGKNERAYSSWRAMKAISPDDLRVFNLGAKILEAVGRNDEAITLLEKSRGIEGGNIESTLLLSKLLHETGKKKESLWVLEALRNQAVSHPEIFLKTAENQLALGDYAAAQEDLSQYRKLAGENKEVFLLLGQTMLLRSFFDGAVRLYSEALEKFPDDPDFFLGLGKALLGIGEKGKALLEFERAGKKAPGRVEILLEMALLFGKMDMDEKAEEIFSKIREQKIRNGEVFLEIAKFYQQRSKNSQAIIELEKAKDLSPHNSEIIKTFGEVLEAAGDYSRALREYESFLEGSPETDWTLFGIIRAARAANEPQKVANAQRSLIKKGQATADLWCDLGETLIRLGKLDDASSAFEEASKLDPTCVRAYQAPELIKLEKARADGEKLVAQAREAVSKKFFLTASELLERALGMVPRETAWMQLLAEVCLKVGEIGRASDLLSKVRVAKPNDFWVSHQLARVFEFEEKANHAIELLSSSLKDSPTNFDGQMLLLRLKRTGIAAKSVEKEMFAALVRNLQHELVAFQKTSPVPLLLEAYIHFLFGMGSKFEQDFVKRGEKLFLEVLGKFGEHPQAHKGLSLIYRAQGDFKKASFHIQELVKTSADPSLLYYVGRFFKNFQEFSEARKCFSSLKNLFPENFLYRRCTIESIALEADSTGKSELPDFINALQEKLRTDSGKQMVLHDLALAQRLMASRSPQKEEWLKRSLLTWNKAVALADSSPWTKWGLMEAQFETLKGPERVKSVQANLRVCEKLAREFPDIPHSHFFLGLAFLAFEDLTQTDRAVHHLEVSTFLNPDFVEGWQILGQSYRAIGKSSKVDVIKQNVILLEPELLIKI
ncbi:MAG: tetratricopeptide repeat protein [Candidatus Riflebacteria bacterium]|nr:tetratricopeptide repeat protein [Candidatus Riflebacteria bacterium]